MRANALPSSDSSPCSEAVARHARSTGTENAVAALQQAYAARTDNGALGLCVPGTAEGILTGVGMLYLAHLATAQSVRLHVAGACQPDLLETVLDIAEDAALARRVLGGFRRATTPIDAKRVLYACQSDDPRRADAVLAYMRLGFRTKEPLWGHRADPAAVPVFDLAQSVSCECERARQFIRFQRMASGVYRARFEPNANVVPLVMGHFTARFNTQAFVIHDPGHRIAGFWDGTSTHFAQVDGDGWGYGDDLGDDRVYQELWKRFYDSVAIDERYNPDLRRQFVPKRFWKNLSELSPLVGSGAPHPNAGVFPAASASTRKGAPDLPDPERLEPANTIATVRNTERATSSRR